MDKPIVAEAQHWRSAAERRILRSRPLHPRDGLASAYAGQQSEATRIISNERMAASASPLEAPVERGVPRRIYRNPPIVETVVSIGFEPSKTLTDQMLEGALASETAYVERHQPPIALADANPIAGFSVGADRVFSARDEVAARAIHLSRDRLAFSKYARYSHWEEVRDEAQRVWKNVVAVIGPVTLTKISLRYVNRLDLPVAEGLHLDQYLKTLPKIANGISGVVSGYTMQINMPQPDMPATLVIVRQATAQSAKPGFASIILDIEVARSLTHGGDASELWDTFEGLHSRENQVFEQTITDRLRTLFN